MPHTVSTTVPVSAEQFSLIRSSALPSQFHRVFVAHVAPCHRVTATSDSTGSLASGCETYFMMFAGELVAKVQKCRWDVDFALSGVVPASPPVELELARVPDGTVSRQPVYAATPNGTFGQRHDGRQSGLRGESSHVRRRVVINRGSLILKLRWRMGFVRSHISASSRHTVGRPKSSKEFDDM